MLDPKEYRTYGRQRSIRLPDPSYRVVGAVYSVTACCRKMRKDLANQQVARVVFETWLEVAVRCGFRVWGLCLMPDHLHGLFEPVQDSEDDGMALADTNEEELSGQPGLSAYTLGAFIRDAKSLSPARVRGVGPLFWQVKFRDHILRLYEDPMVRLRYLLDNPVRKGLVSLWSDWPWTHVDPEAFA